MSDEPGVVDVIHAIATGGDVDWDAVEASSKDASMRELLDGLRLISGVADAHGTSRGMSAGHATDDHVEMPRTRGTLMILERLGSGSYGDVYRAWDSRLEREVALKLSRRSLSDTAVRSALDEGRILARVRHPNVVTVYAAECLEDRVGLCMEFVDGRTLAGVVREHGPLGAQEATLVGIEVCRGLAAVHRAGIIHRDIKARSMQPTLLIDQSSAPSSPRCT